MTAPLESAGLPTQAAPSQGGAPQKSFTVLISDPTGQTPLGIWPDAPIPSVRLGMGGTQAWQFSLPRQYGALDEPGEVAGSGTLAWGNQVSLYVSDPTTQLSPVRPALAGYLVAGAWAAGGASGLGTLIWRGSIEQWDPAVEGGVAVTAVDIDRILDGSPLPGTLTYSGDPVQIARSIVGNFVPGLKWDTGNSNTSGQTVTNLTFTNVMAGSALAQLRDLCGVNWQLLVTPYGSIRLFAPNTAAAATHTLTVGVHCVKAVLHKAGTGRRKRIIVTYAQGHTASAQALDYNPADPRAEFVSADAVTDAGDAARLAALYLAARDQVTLSGECTVLDERYDIESIQPGDTVRLLSERPLGGVRVSLAGQMIAGQWLAGGGDGYLGYGGQNLVIAGITYDLYSARLELSEPQPRLTDIASAFVRQLAALKAKVA